MSPRSTMLDRDVELRALDALLERAAAGRVQVAVLSGEPGIGKTTLLASVADAARERGFVVARATASELSREQPFRVLVDALAVSSDSADPARQRVAELLFAPGQVADPPLLALRVGEELLALLEQLTADQPLLLCLDDLHWADDTTAAALARAVQRLAFQPFALVVARREHPLPRAIAAFLDVAAEASAEALRLHPLSQEATKELARRSLAREPDDAEAREIQKAAGNPLFVTEVLALMREGGASGPAADDLRATVLRRVGRLPARVTELLRAVAVLGPEADVATLAAVLGRRPGALADPLETASTAGLLTQERGVVAFRHGLLAEAVAGSMSPAARAALHLTVADVLAATGAPAAVVAHHRVAGSAEGDDSAVIWLRRAAEESLPLAPAVAADLAEQALACARPVHPERDVIETLRAEALLWSGRPGQAEEAARQLVPRLRDPDLRARARVVLLRAVLVQGRDTEFAQLTEADLALLPERDRAWALAESAYAMVEARHDPAGAQTGTVPGTWWDVPRPRLEHVRALAHEALRTGERLGDRATVCMSLCALSSAADCGGSFPEAIALSRRAVEVADSCGAGPPLRAAPHFHLALQLVLADRVAEGEAVALAGLSQAEKAGAAFAAPLYHHLLGRVHFATGRWDDATADWETALALGAEVGTRMIVGDVVRCFLGQVALHRGDLRAAERHVSAAEREAAAQGAQEGSSPFVGWTRALLLEATGQTAAAGRLAGAVHDEGVRRQWLSVYRLIGTDLARIAAAAASTGVARDVADAMDELARRSGSASTRGAALLARAWAERDGAHALAAVAAYDRSPLVVEAAQADHAAGAHLAATGQTPEGSVLLARARSVYAALGADRLVAAVDADLQRAGLALHPSGRRRRPAVGWDALTESEQRVAELVGQGLSNAAVAQRLVVSPRTVHTHVSHIFTKLGLTSRTQLAAQVARRAAAPPGG